MTVNHYSVVGTAVAECHKSALSSQCYVQNNTGWIASGLVHLWMMKMSKIAKG